MQRSGSAMLRSWVSNTGEREGERANRGERERERESEGKREKETERASERGETETEREMGVREGMAVYVRGESRVI